MKNAFDGFAVNLYLDEDGDWLAHFVERPEVSAFAEIPERALEELAIAWEGVKRAYRRLMANGDTGASESSGMIEAGR